MGKAKRQMSGKGVGISHQILLGTPESLTSKEKFYIGCSRNNGNVTAIRLQPLSFLAGHSQRPA